MNKRLYKIIFNKKRGQMMAVSEHAVREGKSTQDSGCSRVSSGLGVWLGALLLAGQMGFSQARVIADGDAPTNQRPVILKTQNNAPLINIQTPSASGLSHNRYTEFNIENKGVVLNNNRASNPFLAKGTASLILNEVRSTRPSVLEGMIRIDGAKADVILANPSGIQVNGGGFQNTGRSILTTGTPVVKNGALDSLDIRQGTVEIGGRGMFNQDADYTDILSRAVNTQGQLHAQNLLVVTGSQKLDYQSGDLSLQTASGTQPSVGIDTARLGGMYADSITLIANEKGVGVRNEGTIQATNRLVITSAGHIENTGTLKTTATPSAEHSGSYLRLDTIHPEADINLTSGKVESNGLLMADSSRDIDFAGATIFNVHGDIHLNAKKDLRSYSQSWLVAGNDVQLAAEQNVSLTQPDIYAGKDANILASKQLYVDGGNIRSNTGNVHIESAEADTLGASNNASSLVVNNRITAAKNIAWLSDGNLYSSNNTLSAQGLYANSKKRLSLSQIKTDQIQAQNIVLTGEEAVSIDGDTGVNVIPLIQGKEQIIIFKNQTAPIAIQELAAQRNLTVNGGDVFASNVSLSAKQGNLTLGSEKGNIYFGTYTGLSAGKNIEVSSFGGNVYADIVRANATNGHVSVLADKTVMFDASKGHFSSIKTTDQGLLNLNASGMAIRAQQGDVDVTTFSQKDGAPIHAIHAEHGSISLKTSAAAKNQFSGQGVALGSVGNGSFYAGQIDVDARQGNVSLLAGGSLMLNQASDANHNQAKANISGSHVGMHSRDGVLNIDHTTIRAHDGAALLSAGSTINLNNASLFSSHNTQIHSKRDRINLNQVAASSEQHLSVVAPNNFSGHIAQNVTHLSARGMLSLSSGQSHVANNTFLQGGIINIGAGTSLQTIGLNDWRTTPKQSFSTLAAAGIAELVTGKKQPPPSDEPDVLMGELRDIKGHINIESNGPIQINERSTIQAKNDLTVRSNQGALTIAAQNGTHGNDSAQTALLTASGNITLTAAEIALTAGKVLADQDVSLTSTQGQIVVDGVRNTFQDYQSRERQEEFHRKIVETQSVIEGLERDPAYLAAKQKRDQAIREIKETYRGFLGSLKQKNKIEAVEREFSPYDHPLQVTRKQKEALEKGLELLRQNGRGHEHLGAEISGANVSLLSKQGVAVFGSKLNATTGMVNIQAAGLLPELSAEEKQANMTRSSISVDGLFDTFEYGQPNSNRFAYAVLNKPAEIKAKTGIRIAAPYQHVDSRLLLNAAHLETERGTINLQAYGDMKLGSGYNQIHTFEQRSYKTGKWYSRKYHTETKSFQDDKAEPTILSAPNGLHLKSGGDIDAYSTLFDAPRGSIHLTAARALRLHAVQEQNVSLHEHKTKSKFLGIRYDTDKRSNTAFMQTALPSKLVAQTSQLSSGWDTTLEGTIFEHSLKNADIRAGVGEQAKADAKIILKGITTNITTVSGREKNSVVWQSKSEGGTTVESLRLPQFNGSDLPTFSAPGGIVADIPAGELREEIAKLAKRPEYAYLNTLRSHDQIQWQPVNLAYQQWNFRQDGLTPAGAAIVALAVTVATSGTGAALIGAAEGTASAAMANAAFTTLTTQASISLINNKGDIGKVMKELGSKRSVRNLLASMVSAGVANKLTTAAGLQGAPLQGTFMEKLGYNVIQAGSSAGAQVLINGAKSEEALREAILGALVDTVHGEVASKIKGIGGEEWYRYAAHKIAHAAAGCAAAAAKRRECADGAIGAAVGEIVAEAMLGGRHPLDLTPKEREQFIGTIRVVAGTAAAAAGGDVNTAANAAQIAVENNSIITMITKGGKTLYKIYEKAGKIPKGQLNTNKLKQIIKETGADEFIDIAGDLVTIFHKNSSLSDRILAGVDLITGLETNNKGQKIARQTFEDFKKEATKIRQVKDKLISQPLSKPYKTDKPVVILGELDSLGRPTGMVATIDKTMLRTGTSANPNIKPPGFISGSANHARGHLLAKVLGGSGNDRRNLVTLFQKHANSPDMRSFERQVVQAIDSGETVKFKVTPIYSGKNPIPIGITLSARGSKNLKFDVSIRNIDGTN